MGWVTSVGLDIVSVTGVSELSGRIVADHVALVIGLLSGSVITAESVTSSFLWLVVGVVRVIIGIRATRIACVTTCVSPHESVAVIRMV